MIQIESISEISEVNMDMTVTMTVRQVWEDSRLDLRELPGINYLVLPPGLAKLIWVPDIFIEGSKKSFIHATTVDNQSMRIKDNGTIDYTVKITATMLCEMELYYFPLDTETCYIVFQSCKF